MVKAERLSEAVTLYEGDCMDVLPTLEPGSVDAVVTDPPYGIGFKYATHDDSDKGYADWCKTWFSMCKKLCSGPIAISCGIGNLNNWPQAHWVLCWHKPAAMGRCPIGFTNWEPVLLYGKVRGQKTSDVFRAVIRTDSALDGHPCPKPLEWATELISRLTIANDTILDPFAGSGTTGVAAILEGRKAILIEKDPKYCDIIRRRIAEAEATGPNSLFKNVKHPELFGELASAG